MEEARYWMWTKRKTSLNSHVLASSTTSPSWEEQAFAEDAAGPLGGCIWPPRSYSCSFCRREFRSAQALGGHMNVHRRDRARLKQFPNHEVLHHNSDHIHQYPTQVFHNPNSDADRALLASASSPSRVLVPISTQVINCYDDNSFLPNFSSLIVQENHKMTASISSPPPWSNLVADKYFHIKDLKKEEKNPKLLQKDLSVSLNLVVCRAHPTESGDEEESMSYKRRRTDHATTLPFIQKRRATDIHDLSGLDVLELSKANSIEDLDLELRLGDPPKVK
ncbi:hypothetical protein RJ639_031925 [Escallonia herrerae]|uniref:C2H2-type domain-containing protein n=1 Tax=Escallonia herrerae TaxID=1293975 RepID=A0AA88X030_9ASTE|nr:hypothetical protein RJ639_031925 [Escallonia herrerae]